MSIPQDPIVMVFGASSMDFHGTSSDKLSLHDSNPGQVHAMAGGVGRNIAENLARLGVGVRLVSAVGGDSAGNELLAAATDAGIDVSLVLRTTERTDRWLSIADNDGNLHVAIADMRAIEHLDSAYLSAAGLRLEDCAACVVEANLQPAALKWVFEHFDGPVFADTVSAAKASKLAPYLDRLYALKTGPAEAAALLNIEEHADPASLLSILRQAGVRNSFVTAGTAGLCYDAAGAEGQLAPADAVIANGNGAGDAFLAGVVTGFLQDWPHQKTAGFAMAAAQLTAESTQTCRTDLSFKAVEDLYIARYSA